jgi:hypothetical protein
LIIGFAADCILIFNLAEFQQVIPDGIYDWHLFQQKSSAWTKRIEAISQIIERGKAGKPVHHSSVAYINLLLAADFRIAVDGVWAYKLIK